VEGCWKKVGFDFFFLNILKEEKKVVIFRKDEKFCLLVSFFIPDFWFFGLSAFVICYETFISLQLN